MMIKKNEIESKYLKLYEDEITTQEFETWIYESEENIILQSSEEVYYELVQIDYRSKEAKHEISKIIEVNYDELFRYKIYSMLSKVLKLDRVDISNVKYQMLFDLNVPSFSFQIGGLKFLMNCPFAIDEFNFTSNSEEIVEDIFIKKFVDERLFIKVISEAIGTNEIRIWHPKLTEHLDSISENKLLQPKSNEVQIVIENNHTFIDQAYLILKMKTVWH